MNGGKPTTKKLQSSRRLIVGEDVSYEERRGLLSVRLDGNGKSHPDSNAVAKQLAAKARAILAEAKEQPIAAVIENCQQSLSNDPDAQNQALLRWYSEIATRHGLLSPQAFSAKFLGLNVSIHIATIDMLMPEAIVSDEEATAVEQRLAKHMTQINALCNAWHHLRMEISGTHELAFSKVKHKASAAKGTQGTKSKAAERANLVREQIEILRLSGGDPVKMVSAPYVARKIKAKTLESFGKARLPNGQSDATFEKIVRRVMGK